MGCEADAKLARAARYQVAQILGDRTVEADEEPVSGHGSHTQVLVLLDRSGQAGYRGLDPSPVPLISQPLASVVPS